MLEVRAKYKKLLNPLFQKADQNKDGVLSYQEVIENYDVFVGSQATDYGRILHEEL